ncbi:MAG: dihydroorotate dehydrogenase electron transfer subunit [Clostridia bacterium]|nr:dihydroorotate dehydrogenase electron transfer subunit [Clostridia bacterium]
MAEYNLTIVKTEYLLPNIVSMLLDISAVTEEIRPGQFFQVTCGGDTYLRRPISVCDVTVYEGHPVLRLVLEVKGKGTHLLAEKKVGDSLCVLGPFGNGFNLKDVKKVDLIGGGLGVCPLFYLTRALLEKGVETRVFLGFRNQAAIFLTEEFKALGADVTVSTDDGSFGEKGYAINVYKANYTGKPDMLYTCGPQVMMNTVVAFADEQGILYQESREERMGCGFGACLVCACKMQDDSMGHVCKDGPVFGTGMVAVGGKVAHHG